MNKVTLLERLADARWRTQRAHLDILVSGQVVAGLEKQGLDATGAKVLLKASVNEEQKHLTEMGWLLDQLDKIAR